SLRRPADGGGGSHGRGGALRGLPRRDRRLRGTSEARLRRPLSRTSTRGLMDELEWVPAWRQRELSASREIAPVELTRRVLDRIDALDPRLHAFISVFPDQALARARWAEATVQGGEALGALHGVPVTLKDVIWTKGLRSTGGSRLYADHVPDD